MCALDLVAPRSKYVGKKHNLRAGRRLSGYVRSAQRCCPEVKPTGGLLLHLSYKHVMVDLSGKTLHSVVLFIPRREDWDRDDLNQTQSTGPKRKDKELVGCT